ncbi:MAG: RNA polymerase sigma factor SigM [Gordonia sp. (in: high G+C Gram-positive bacteria)]
MNRGIINDISDADLLAGCAAGDHHAFRTLVERHQNYLWSVAIRTTVDYEDAADAMQDALLSIYRTAKSFRSDATALSWMHRIVVNSCLDRLRRNKCHDTSPLPPFEDESLADDHDYTEHVDLALSIGRALDVLPNHQRAAIIAVDVEGMSIDEAAEVLGIAAGTVKSRCSRGRLKLALVLRHLNDGE